MRSRAARSCSKPKPARPICRAGWNMLIWRPPVAEATPGRSASSQGLRLIIRPHPDHDTRVSHVFAERRKNGNRPVIGAEMLNDRRKAFIPKFHHTGIRNDGRPVILYNRANVVLTGLGAQILVLKRQRKEKSQSAAQPETVGEPRQVDDGAV